MNPLEFSSKTLLCYSVRKNVRIDMSTFQMKYLPSAYV